MKTSFYFFWNAMLLLVILILVGTPISRLYSSETSTQPSAEEQGVDELRFLKAKNAELESTIKTLRIKIKMLEERNAQLQMQLKQAGISQNQADGNNVVAKIIYEFGKKWNDTIGPSATSSQQSELDANIRKELSDAFNKHEVRITYTVNNIITQDNYTAWLEATGKKIESSDDAFPGSDVDGSLRIFVPLAEALKVKKGDPLLLTGKCRLYVYNNGEWVPATGNTGRHFYFYLVMLRKESTRMVRKQFVVEILKGFTIALNGKPVRVMAEPSPR